MSKVYTSAESLTKWLDFMKRYVEELQNESGSDNIHAILHDGKHNGYIREFKSYLKAIPEELDINLD